MSPFDWQDRCWLVEIYSDDFTLPSIKFMKANKFLEANLNYLIEHPHKLTNRTKQRPIKNFINCRWSALNAWLNIAYHTFWLCGSSTCWWLRDCVPFLPSHCFCMSLKIILYKSNCRCCNDYPTHRASRFDWAFKFEERSNISENIPRSLRLGCAHQWGSIKGYYKRLLWPSISVTAFRIGQSGGN